MHQQARTHSRPLSRKRSYRAVGRYTTTLVKSSLQPSSIPTYQRARRLYNQFSSSVLSISHISLPISPSNVGLFIAFVFQCSYAASTAYTYVSALGYSHLMAVFSDPTKVFWVTEMLPLCSLAKSLLVRVPLHTFGSVRLRGC